MCSHDVLSRANASNISKTTQRHRKRSLSGGEEDDRAPHHFDGGSALAMSTGMDSRLVAAAFLSSEIAALRLRSTAFFSSEVALQFEQFHLSNEASSTREGFGKKDGNGATSMFLSICKICILCLQPSQTTTARQRNDRAHGNLPSKFFCCNTLGTGSFRSPRVLRLEHKDTSLYFRLCAFCCKSADI